MQVSRNLNAQLRLQKRAAMKSLQLFRRRRTGAVGACKVPPTDFFFPIVVTCGPNSKQDRSTFLQKRTSQTLCVFRRQRERNQMCEPCSIVGLWLFVKSPNALKTTLICIDNGQKTDQIDCV